MEGKGSDEEGRVASGAGRKRSSSLKSADQPAQKRSRKKSDAESSTEARARAKDLIERREAMERSLITLEQQIFALETSYLEDTHSRGNILSGWGNYYLSRRGAVSQRKPNFSIKHRVFSLSSTTALQANGLSNGRLDRDDEDSGRDDGGVEDEDDDAANGDRSEEESKREKKMVRRKRTDSYNLD